MQPLRPLLIGLFIPLLLVGCWTERVDDDRPSAMTSSAEATAGETSAEDAQTFQGIAIRPAEPEINLTDEEWKERLGEEQYQVLCEERTERPFSGELLGNERDGVYRCAGCGQELFSSQTRFDSETGWPSFWSPFDDDAVGTRLDDSLGQTRVEVHCGRCGGHLGHVFPDGPQPTGHRYCINSVALEFEEDQ